MDSRRVTAKLLHASMHEAACSWEHYLYMGKGEQKHMIRRIFLFAVIFLSAVMGMAKTYLAKPSMSTKALQELIDQASNKGGGKIIFGQGEYLTGQLELKSGVELYLEKGAVILGSTSPFDYHHVDTQSAAGDRLNDKSHLGLIVARNASHIGITGDGTIDGQGLALALTVDSLHHTGVLIDQHYNVRRQRPCELVRPTLFNFLGCQDVHIEGVHLRNSAGWGLSFNRCRDMVLRGLDIFNRAYWNNDGIDLTDCQNVLVEDCKVNSADDGICLKSYDPNSGNDSITSCNCEGRMSSGKCRHRH